MLRKNVHSTMRDRNWSSTEISGRKKGRNEKWQKNDGRGTQRQSMWVRADKKPISIIEGTCIRSTICITLGTCLHKSKFLKFLKRYVGDDDGCREGTSLKSVVKVYVLGGGQNIRVGKEWYSIRQVGGHLLYTKINHKAFDTLSRVACPQRF